VEPETVVEEAPLKGLKTASRKNIKSSSKTNSGIRKRSNPSAQSRVTGPDELEAVLRRATEVIGNKQEAMRWLGTPVRALNYATPTSLMGKPSGIKTVWEALGRLEHGIL